MTTASRHTGRDLAEPAAAHALPARSLTSETARYFVIHALVVLGGLVSMPISTRMLSQEQYGQLSLIISLVGVVTVAGTLGFANGTTRLFPQYRLGKPSLLRAFCETMLTGSFVVSLAFAAVLGFFGESIFGWPHSGSTPASWLVAGVLILRIVMGVVVEVLRSAGAVDALGVVRVGMRWAMIPAAAIAMWIVPRATSVIAVTVLVETSFLVGSLLYLRGRNLVRRPRLMASVVREANAYGAPLALASGVAMVTVYADRFLIGHYLGAESVAQYSVPYDLARELAKALYLPIQMALVPRIFQRWTEQREQEVGDFVSSWITMLLAVAIPAGALFAALGPEIITWMASARYADSARLIPYMLAGIFLNEGAFLLGIAQRLARRTGFVALVSVGAVILNVLLNVALIPRFGLEGAAIATTLTYVVMTLILYRASAPVLKLRVGAGTLVRSAAVSAVAFVAVRAAGELSTWAIADIALRGAAGAAFCAAAIFAIDEDVRRTGRQLARRIGVSA